MYCDQRYLHSIHAITFGQFPDHDNYLKPSFNLHLKSHHIPLNHLPWVVLTQGIPLAVAYGTTPAFIYCVWFTRLCDSASFVVPPLACTRPLPVVAYNAKPEENLVANSVTFLDLYTFGIIHNRMVFFLICFGSDCVVVVQGLPYVFDVNHWFCVNHWLCV